MAKTERGNLLGALLGVLLLPALIVLGPAAAAQPTPPECFGQPATIVGTGAGETLNGTAGDDVIVGLGGADKIEGRGGDDRICGGAGSDTINGGGGNDLISGETGSDKISGGGGGDRIFGGPDDDTLSGDTGNDFLFGEGGADSMDGGDGQDNCFVESRSDDASGCESNLPPNQAPTDITLSNSSLAENQPSGSTVGTLAAVDPDIGDSHTFALVPGAGDADNGRFAISGSSLNTAAVLDFESQATYSVLVRATDIGGLFVEKAFTITVTDTNEPPLVDTVSGGLSYTENDPATVVAGVITVTDPDSANLTGATVQITGNYAAGQDVLAMAAQPNITAAFDAGTGTLTLSGTDTVAAYEAALESVTYHNTSDDPATPNRSVAFAARDAAGFGPPDVREIAIVAVDDPPAAVSDNASASEDSTSNAIDVLANDTDPDGGPKSVSAVSQPANGSVAITNNGAGVHYTPNPNYCNSPPGTSPDSFTYTLNGVSQATVSVLVSCDDDPPVGVNDSASVAEDSSANAIDVLANDTDVDGGPKSVASVTQPPNGSVTITGGGAGVSYTPNADYCNASTTDDSFTYTLNGGSTASVFVTVNCADDAPAAINDSATVAEDSSSNAIDVLANDTDVDGGTKTIESVTQPANGLVAITGGGTGLSYTPNADYCNAPPGTAPDTFNYTINGGLAATVSVTVNCSGDAPVVDNSAGTTTFTENSAAVAVDGSVTVADADAGAAISEATVEITGNYAAGEDVLALGGSHPGISASVAGNKLTLTGPASPAAFQAALRDVTYVNTAETPSELLRTLTFTVTDDTNLSGSDTKSLSVAGADDPPAGVNDLVTVAEDSSSNAIDVLANDTDADGGPKSVDSVTQPANGSVAVTGGGTGVSYTPNAQYCNSPPGDALDIFTYTLNGGSTATVSVTVTCSPDAPVVDTSAGTTTYTENAAPSGIDPNVTVVDADAGATITGATVRITSNFAPGQDILALAGTHGPGITATFSGDTLTLSGTASISAYQAALQEVTYANSSEGPSTLIRTVTFTVTDNTALTGSDTKSLEVTPVNDPPTAVDDAGTTDEDTILPVAAPGVLANDTDIDPGDTKTVVALNSSGTLSGSTAKGGSVTINANGSYSYTPPAAFQALSTGQSDTDSFTYTMADGGGAESTATVNLTVTGISDAPTAVADTFDAIGNTGLFAGRSAPGGEAAKVVTGSVLDNDTDPDSPHTSLVAEPVVNAATALGGMITIEPDGNFTYHPDDGDVGVTDTFTYRVCDASPCNSATVANSTGTLSLPLAGQVWYVKNNQPDGGDGTSDTPFDTLAEAELASGAGDTVYVFDGDNTSADLDTGYVMATDERLIGESRPLAKDPDGGGPLPLSLLYTGIPGAQPTLTASNEDVVVLASNSIVDGIDVDPSGTGGGFSAGAGVAGVGVFRSNVIDSGTAGTQPGIELDGTTGSSGFSQVTVTNGGSSGAIGIRLNNAGTVSFPTGNSITTTGAKALDIASTSMGNSVFNSITVTDSSTGGVRMSATTGNPITFGDGAGTDLSLTTTSGTAPALELKNTGRVLIPSAGNSSISATGGPAVDIVNPGASSSFELDSVSSTNSAGDGINLDGAGVNLFSAPSGSISGAAAIAVDVNDGGAISYGGALNDGAGSTAEITGRSSGHTLALSGNIADSSDAGGGIALSGNSSGAVIFSGSSKVINTGAGDAVVATGNPGHALELSGGGLDIDTTGGRGLEASGGGSIRVQGTGNTITTTTGTPLNITNVTIT
ncbi:MAG TPA: Ig-like domain-containing protein, partial [Actinomycetota bacterium]|nr:Ig-like domain-containing protein [Actinomycetota bacterium]